MASSSSHSSTTMPSSLPLPTHHSLYIKLTTKNFIAWKTQFLPLINYQKLNSYIDGTPPPPSTIPSASPNTIAPNPKYQQWYMKDQMLISWIFSSLSEEIFPYVTNLTTSYDAWTAISNAFGSVFQNRQLQLNIQLQDLKKNDLSVSDFLQKAKSLADELETAWRKINTAEFNTISYRNIGAEYHPVITARNLRPFPATFHELHGQLVAHEILLKSTLDSPLANLSITHKPIQLPLLPTPCPNLTNTSQQYRRRNNQASREPCQIC